MDFGYSLPIKQNNASVPTQRLKPAVPKKPVKFMLENDIARTTHVKDMVRKLQEKESPNSVNNKLNFFKMGVKASKSLPVTMKEDVDAQASKQTLEDLKAIDEDIEKLRKQIEERDKIISALREAAEEKDKKLEKLMMENSKHRSNEKLDLETSSEPNRSTLSSPSSPPLCNGELCWTDSFVNTNYHEPVYAQLLNDHTALQKIYNELRAKLESKGKELERLEKETRATQDDNKMENHENAINLIMAEQIRVLKEREAQLIAEAEELREQRDLMEFRILELEECRKEFLDKEVISEEKHSSEKMVWPERDIEDISDSGVMSLPTSEDLTSDSELGDAIRNYSPLGAVTNLILLSNDNSNLDTGLSDLKIKKSLKSSECLQESGIFEDPESLADGAILSAKQTKGCQTESILDKTLLDFIDSSCDLLISRNRNCYDQKCSDDLSTEISKLSVIQKRIQQKTKSPNSKGPHTVFTCPHTNNVLFYEERLAQLEDKLKIYESSGDTKDILLSKRLQKEVELAYRVKELTEKVSSLEANNRRLEEEKCEFEEAENDTRFQCQRLEIRLQELLDKNTELELELERQKLKMNEERRRDKKKESLENLITRYEQRNFELEEKEVETKQRLTLIEAAMPAIIAWNMFRMVQNPEFSKMTPENSSQISSQNSKIQEADDAMFQKLEELLDDQRKLRRDYEKVEESAADREKVLRLKIEELELKAARDREMLEEMTNSLKSLKMEEKCEVDMTNGVRPDEIDLFEELKQMVANEIHLRGEIERLQKKEQAYMDSLEKADEIWASMEADYKRRLTEAEAASGELQKRVSRLEETQEELEKALEMRAKLEPDIELSKHQLNSKIEELIQEKEALKIEFAQNLELKFEEQKKFLEVENVALREELKKLKSDIIKEESKYNTLEKELQQAKEEALKDKKLAESLKKEIAGKKQSVTDLEKNLQRQISELTLELNHKGREISNLEVTVAELREEVETLENKVAELVDTIQTTIANQEEDTCTNALNGLQPTELTAEQIVSDEVKEPTKWEAEAELLTKNIMVKAENILPSLEILIPNKFCIRYKVFAASYLPRQEMRFLYPKPSITCQFSLYKQVSPPLIFCARKNACEELYLSNEDELFQLSLKNIELQQALEKMEEESKQKNKELEELQKIAIEIRKEQANLKLLYEKNISKNENETVQSGETLREISNKALEDEKDLNEERKKTTSLDILQILNPIVKTSFYPVPNSISNLQIALDNLQNKCRAKNFVVKSLLDELQEKGDSLDCEEMVNQISLQNSSLEGRRSNNTDNDQNDEEMDEMKNLHAEKDEDGDVSRESCASAEYISSTNSMLPSLESPERSEFDPNRDTEFSFVAPIRTLRKVDDSSIFLEWDITQKPNNVTGYEIFVNGNLSHRVRSSTRHQALLHSLDLKKKLLIQVFAMSDIGRSNESSHVTYLDSRTKEKNLSAMTETTQMEPQSSKYIEQHPNCRQFLGAERTYRVAFEVLRQLYKAQSSEN